jgi:hypothetical protein
MYGWTNSLTCGADLGRVQPDRDPRYMHLLIRFAGWVFALRLDLSGSFKTGNKWKEPRFDA